MAVMTTTKDPREQMRGTGIGEAVSTNGSNGTANQTYQAQPYTQPSAYQKTQYTPSSAVQQAQAAIQQHQATKPQGYNSKYGAQLDALIEQITNPQKFEYSFDGDELFKSYADLYNQNAKQASMNAMGQAAALTGGYGSSYGQQVGQQAYDETMRGLYDIGLDLRDRAYQKYRDDQAALQNQYGVLSGEEEKDYGRYRDTLSDYEREMERLTGRYDTERNFDYGSWQDQRDFDYNSWQDQRNFDYNTWKDQRDFDYNSWQDQRNFEETQRQFNESLDWDKMSNEQKYAYETAMQILANGQMPSEGLLLAAGLSAEDAQLLMAQVAAAGGGGGGGTTRKTDTPQSTGDPEVEAAYAQGSQVGPWQAYGQYKTDQYTKQAKQNEQKSSNTVDTTKMNSGQYAAYQAQKNAKKN